jgi:hypothetical protein
VALRSANNQKYFAVAEEEATKNKSSHIRVRKSFHSHGLWGILV